MSDTGNAREKGNQPSLEEVLTLFQKAVSRADRDTSRTHFAEIGYLRGRKTLYQVDRVSVSLNVGVSVGEPSISSEQHIMLDFDSPANVRSSIGFEISEQPTEPASAPGLYLSLQPIEHEDSIREMSITIMPEDHPSDTAIPYSFTIMDRTGNELISGSGVTDLIGRALVAIDPATGACSADGKPVGEIPIGDHACVFIAVSCRLGNDETDQIDYSALGEIPFRGRS